MIIRKALPLKFVAPKAFEMDIVVLCVSLDNKGKNYNKTKLLQVILSHFFSSYITKLF